MASKPVGWQREPARHALAAKGVETGRKSTRRGVSPRVKSTVDPLKNKREVVKGISTRWNCDLDTARDIFDWIRDNRPDRLYEQHFIGSEGTFYVPEYVDIADACDALGIPRYEFRLIAGRGEGMQMNWGVDPNGLPQESLDKWQKELEKHIGEEVYLSGGGGSGIDKVKLIGVEQEVWNTKTGRMGLRAKLQRLEDRPLHYKKGEIFDPWMDSWQISVEERVN